MLYDFIHSNFQNDEPIFLSELPGKTKNSVRQEMKRLTDQGKIVRVYNGVYIRSYEKYIDKKFINEGGKVFGYMTGLRLANFYGFTSQNAACYEVCSNRATTKQRKMIVDGKRIIVYESPVKITKENVGVNATLVKEYIEFFPKRVYENLFKLGVYNVLV